MLKRKLMILMVVVTFFAVAYVPTNTFAQKDNNQGNQNGNSQGNNNGKSNNGGNQILPPAMTETDIVFNAPSWVLSDYVLWELLDYMATGDEWISYVRGGVSYRKHINVIKDGSETNVYFNWERFTKNNIPVFVPSAMFTPGSRGISWPYYAYSTAANSLRGFYSNGAASNEEDLSLNLPLPLAFKGNSDDVLDYAKISQYPQDLKIFKEYAEQNPTTLHLGTTLVYDDARNGNLTKIDNNPSTYVQLGELLADVASKKSQLSVILYGDSTLTLAEPVILQTLELKNGSVLNLSEMSRQALLNKTQMTITVDGNATIMLPAGMSDADIAKLSQKFSIIGNGITWKVFPFGAE